MNTQLIKIVAVMAFLVSTISAQAEVASSPNLTCTATCPVQTDHRIDVLIDATKDNTNSIQNLEERLSNLHCNFDISTSIPKSCQEIQQRSPTSSSGVYLIAASEKKTQHVYCHMESLCGTDGPWTRLAHIDMTDSSENCPGGLRLYESGGVRACGRPAGEGSCHSIKYNSHGVKYNQVCGRVRGYQYNSPDAIDRTIRDSKHHDDINSLYVDGVSVTRGTPRQHVWTLIAGLKEDNSVGGAVNCPCQSGSTQSKSMPSFIGNDYYCESGNPAQPKGFAQKLYTADPLWDGEKCRGLEADCCKPSLLPWFHKQLSKTTNDYIEVRVCGDQNTGDEDVPIEQLEIYVK